MASLLRTHRAMLWSLAAMLLVSLASSGWLLGVSEPRVERYTELTRLARVSNVAMLEQQVALRGWIATGDDTYLDGIAAAAATVAGLDGSLLERAAGDPEATRSLVATMLARQEWQSFADQRIEAGRPDPAQARVVLLTESDLFDAYDAAEDVAIGLAIEHRDGALARQRASLYVVAAAYMATIAVAVLLAVRRRRELEVTVVEPIDRLLETIGALRRGDLRARAQRSDVVELDAMGDALAALADDLQTARDEAAAREDRLALMAARLAAVVRIAREVSGSVSVRYVSESVASAAAELLGAPATLWVRATDGAFRATRRSDDPHGVVPPSDLPVPQAVVASAADARTTTAAGARAYPLVLGGMVVGVLQVTAVDVDDDTEAALAALLSTAAAALEAARMHGAAQELAEHDALTQLPNRRRLDTELTAEWERSRRYARPLSFLMIDLDRFKQLNDTHGHLVGDEMLHAVAVAVRDALRTTDTAYRYGGEELAVLLRETDLDGALLLAERIRSTIAGLTLPTSDARVTASIGVAQQGPGMPDAAAMVATADAALYAAKRGGRDRVVAGNGTHVGPPVPEPAGH